MFRNVILRGILCKSYWILWTWWILLHEILCTNKTKEYLYYVAASERKDIVVLDFI